jgi:hypothetical protein
MESSELAGLNIRRKMHRGRRTEYIRHVGHWTTDNIQSMEYGAPIDMFDDRVDVASLLTLYRMTHGRMQNEQNVGSEARRWTIQEDRPEYGVQ